MDSCTLRCGGAAPELRDSHRGSEFSGADILRDLYEDLTTETADARYRAEHGRIVDDQ